MEFLKELIPLVTLAGVLISVVIAIRKPNEKQDIDISGLSKDVFYLQDDNKQAFLYISKLNEELALLRKNDLAHIEIRLDDVDKSLIRLETIIKERLSNKTNGFKKDE